MGDTRAIFRFNPLVWTKYTRKYAIQNWYQYWHHNPHIFITIGNCSMHNYMPCSETIKHMHTSYRIMKMYVSMILTAACSKRASRTPVTKVTKHAYTTSSTSCKITRRSSSRCQYTGFAICQRRDYTCTFCDWGRQNWDYWSLFIIHGDHDAIHTYTIKCSSHRAISSITSLTSITVISTTYRTIGFGALSCSTNHEITTVVTYPNNSFSIFISSSDKLKINTRLD